MANLKKIKKIKNMNRMQIRKLIKVENKRKQSNNYWNTYNF